MKNENVIIYIDVCFDVTNYGIISPCPECLYNDLTLEEYIDLLRLIYNLYYELDNYRLKKEVEKNGKSRKSKKKSRQKDIQKSC